MKNLRITKMVSVFSKHSMLACMIAGGMLSLNSCDDKSNLEPSPKSVVTPTLGEIINVNELDEIAKALAASMGDESVRALIKTEALKKFDGDFDILYQKIGDQNVGGKTLNAVLNENGRKNGASRTVPIAQLAAQMPLLNISVPVNIEKWNTGSFEPLVVIASSIKDDEKLKLIKAYDKNGKVYMLDAQKAPDYPVIVVGLNERTTFKNGKVVLRTDLIFPKKPSSARGNNEIIYDGGGSGDGGGGGGTCTALYSSGIVLKGYKSGNISAIESWFNGGPEIRMTCASSDQNGNSVNIFGQTQGNYHNPDRSWVDNTWWDLNDYLFNWQQYYGDMVTFVLWEEDYGTFVNLPVTVKGKFYGVEISSTFTINLSDDNEWIGSFPVYREDFCRDKVFGNNSLYFKLGY